MVSGRGEATQVHTTVWVKRSPDSGVATAVQGIIQHQSFKRMLMFGLRSLADFCNPTNQLFQENANDAMDRGVLDAMKTAVTNFADDPDLLGCVARIVWAMSEAAKDELDATRIAALKSTGGPICVTIVNSSPTEAQTVEDSVNFVENMSKVGSPIDGASLASGLSGMLAKGGLCIQPAARVAAALAIVSKGKDGAVAVAKAGGAQSALQFALSNGDMSETAGNLAEGVFDTCKNVALCCGVDGSILQSCIALMEKYRSKKGVAAKGSAALAVMVGPEELQKCLSTLKSSSPGSDEHENALVTLGSMSYISSFTDEIVKAGGIPLLLELINSGLQQIETNPAKIYEMIKGAAKMLARIASNPANVDLMVKVGGCATLSTAVSYCTESLEALGALCLALTPLTVRESLASEIVQYQAFATVLPILYQKVEEHEFASAAMELVASGSQHQALQQHMIDNLAVEICSMCCSYHLDDVSFQKNSMTSLIRLADRLQSLASLAQYEGFTGINASLHANVANESICLSAVQLLEKLSKVSDATSYMSGNQCVESILGAMLEHEANEALISSGIACLTVIATDADCNNYLSDLENAIQVAKGDPDRVYKCLAAICGLSRVGSLRQIFEQKHAATTVLAGIQKWIDGSRFEGQGRVVRAGLKTVKTIKVSGDGDLSKTLVSLCDVASMPQVKRIVELEEPDDNILVHSTACGRDIAATGRIYGNENIEAAIEGVLKVMRKYTDSRRCQINCIETLNYLTNCDSGAGVHALIKCGAINAVVQYLNRSPIYLDAQIAGFTVLANCAKIYPNSAEVMNKCNVLSPLKVAMRTHSKSKELKRTIAPLLALLMPVDALEKEIEERVKACDDAVAAGHIANLHENLSSLNELLVSAEAAKIAARIKCGEHFERYGEYIRGNRAAAMAASDYDILGNDLYVSTIGELAHAAEQVAVVRTGCVHLIKTGNVENLIALYNALISTERSSYSEEAALHVLEGLRLMIKTDKKSADIAFDSNFVATLCKGIEANKESPTVLAATCGCLAAMATSPTRVTALVAQPDFANLLKKLVEVIRTDSKENKLVAMKALQELLQSSQDPALVDKICEAGAVQTLCEVIDNYSEDSDIVKEAAKTLDLIGTDDLRKAYVDDIRRPCAMIINALNKQDNEQAALYLLRVLNRFTTADDRAILKELGAMEQVSTCLRIHSENAEILAVSGELFAKMGADEQIKSLMLQIIQTVEAGDENAIAKIDELCSRLAIFLAAPLDDPADALQYTEKSLGALIACLQTGVNDPRFNGNVAVVVRRLCDRCFDDPNDSYGAWAVASSGMLQQISQMVVDGSNDTNKAFLVPAYRIMAACASNPYSMPTVQELAQTVLPQAYAHLERHKNDPEIVGRILEYLRYLAEDPTAAQLILTMNGSSGDIVDLTQLLMNQHQTSDAVVANGMLLVGALAYNSAASGAEALPKVQNGSFLRDCEAICSNHTSDERRLAYLNLMERLVLSQAYNDALAENKVLQKVVLRLDEDKKRTGDEQRVAAFCGALRVLQAAGAAGLVGEIEKAKGFDFTLQCAEDYPDNARVLTDCCLAFASMAASDANLATRCIREAVPLLSAEPAETIAADATAADAFCNLLMQLCATEGNGRQLLGMPKLEALMANIDFNADNFGEEVGAEIKKKTAMIRQAMEDDQPHEKMCKDVYEMLAARQAAEQSIIIDDNAVIEEELEFVMSKMTAYNKEKLSAADPLGVDHQYGNMALEILATVPQNYKPLQAVDLIKMELSLIKSIRDEEIVVYCCKTLAAMCKNPQGAQETARTSGAPAVSAESIQRINKCNMTNDRKEEHLCVRLLLLERMAINRNLFNKTNAMVEIIKAWNDYDKGCYTLPLLRQVFRAMRKIVSDAHVDELLKANVIQRLIAIIKDPSSDISILPDVLFLLGSLAVVPEIKSKIGELQGVDACSELLKTSLPNPAAAAVLTNTCLALANICIGHKKNSEIFQKLGGPDINVRVLNERGGEYDVCNAASVLLCNLLYKNENMKKLMGTNGAPAALVKGLSQYDGSLERSAIRCLESLFKAISNMSLYTPNIPPFLEAGIEHAYSTWLNNLDETFPDAQLETGCRTLANLVMENDPSNMKKFGVCLLPCMRVANQGRQDTKALILLLDIQASLCRLAENAEVFAQNGGVETTVRIIHQFDYDVGLLTLGIHLLGIQSSIPSSIKRLVDADVFSILVGCVEVDAEGNELTDLVVGGLRCTRRIIQTQELAFDYCNAGGIASIANVICKSVYQPMVMLEACRVLLCLLALTTTSQEDRQKAVDALNEAAAAAGEEADAEQLAAAAYGGWYHMGMDEVMIGAIIQALCGCAGLEAHSKQLRLQRVCIGLVAYFVSEQMGIEPFIGSGGDLMLIQALTVFSGEQTVVQMSCVIVNSIAQTSGDMYDSLKSRELITAFKTAVGKMATKKSDEKAIHDACQKTVDGLNSNNDPLDAFSGTVTELNFSLTEWNIDPYPNGVHDLPAPVKEALRKGGKLKIYIGERDAEEVKWRSSQDLNALEWNVGAETDWNNKVPIVRVRNVAKGIVHPSLERAHKKEPRKVTSKMCLCIFGPPVEDHPQGLQLPLRAKNQKERDQLVEMLVQWRDAATYNF